MTWVDYCILSIILFSILVGVLRGFVREALGAATWVAAIIASRIFGPDAASHLSDQIAAPAMRAVAGYAMVFFVGLFIGALLTHLISLLVDSAGIGGVDRTLGAGFGLIRGLVAVVIVLMIVSVSTSPQERWWRESQLVPPLMPLADELRSFIPERWLALLRSTDPRTLPALHPDSALPTASPSSSRTAVHPAQGS